MAEVKNSVSAWKVTPRLSSAIFLTAVFSTFATLGFANDVTDMGRETVARLTLGVVITGLCAVGYAFFGIALRGKSWMAILPLFALQFVLMGVVGNYFAPPLAPSALDRTGLNRLQERLGFDSLALVISICAGYAGFVYVFTRRGAATREAR
jgi:hypothetical protein